jgi:YfiH family protein
MIRPPLGGVAFSEAVDGDIRNDSIARALLSETLGVPSQWATVRQVHGAVLVRVEAAGEYGEADAIWTTVPDLPVAVFTADCFGVVLRSTSAVGVAHAGWRGADSGVAAKLRLAMEEAGHPPVEAAIGPGIASCCFEVGPEVAALFPNAMAATTWGTTSVDLRQSLLMQLNGLETWTSPSCTYHEDGFFSHRRDATLQRLAAVGWLE